MAINHSTPWHPTNQFQLKHEKLRSRPISTNLKISKLDLEKTNEDIKGILANDDKVLTFLEAHQNLHNLPHALYIYLINNQTMRKIFSNFVCFSECRNVNKYIDIVVIMHNR